MSEWQLMNTAPKNSARFLAWSPYDGIMIAKWGDRYLSRATDKGTERVFGWIPAGAQPGASCEPTHWMPLPEIPDVDLVR